MRALLGIAVLPACIFTPPPALSDDDVPPALTVGFDSPAQTQNEAVGTIGVPVSLSASSDQTVTVMVGLGAGTAMLGDDFEATATTLTFQPGVTTRTVDVMVKADANVGEPDETIILVLSGATGASLGAATHTITITENTVCVGTGVYQVCPSPAPSTPVTVPATLDTTNDPLCAAQQPAGWLAAGQPASCFVVGTTVTVNDTVVTGTRPLVLVATDAIAIGNLDASSHPGGRGPGSPAADCDAFVQQPANTTNGAPGGAGGTFRTKGGNGGDGAGSNSEGRSPAPDSNQPAVLRAGCDGQAGGTGDGPAGAPGQGGGAVYLAATNQITITGFVSVSGSGAAASTQNASGGSGGGTGGMLKLSATTLVATGARVLVNGGGGAAGAGENSPGNPGGDPVTTVPLIGGLGGLPGTDPAGTAGGNGFGGGTGALAAANVNGNANNVGGGGGGGGGGFIQTSQSLTAAGATTSGQTSIAP